MRLLPVLLWLQVGVGVGILFGYGSDWQAFRHWGLIFATACIGFGIVGLIFDATGSRRK